MRVAVVTPRFPPDPGGVEQYAAWVCRTLRAAGHDVTVVATGPARPTDALQDVPVVRLGTWLTLSNTPVNPLWCWQLRRLLARLRVDLVSAHAPVPGLADVAAFTSPVPVVLTYHGGSMVKGDRRVDALLRAYERRVLPRVFARAAELVAVSPVALSYATGRATLVPPGVDTERFSPPGPGADRELRVLYVGRVERTSRWKGLHVLVESLPRLRARVPGVRLEVVGDGDDVEALQKRAAELGVADVVDWAGRLPHDELPGRYRRAGVTVLPSLTASESFGMTLVEAMACGCPVVGSDVGGIPSVVRDGVDGVLVPPGDPAALAEALAGVLTAPDRAARLGTAGRDAAVTRWDWRQQEARTVALHERAARRGAGPDAETEEVAS
jgi:glycosyltransferase involved in cell wall biosynthesis